MKFYPIQVDLSGKRCVVVGGGAVAERKVAALREYGVMVCVVAPEVTEELRALAETSSVTWMESVYQPEHLDGAFLVIAATDNREVNAAVVRDAQERNTLVCAADRFADGNFVSPSTVVRGDLMLTVSTSGQSPTLAAVLRERLMDEFGEEWAGYAQLFGALRQDLKAHGATEPMRKSMTRRVLDDPEIRALVCDGKLLEAEAQARQCLSSWSE
ncbi:MAG: bifunctional precorrin-2 dehydrogenase/sirohydrochlorin ferrochelatase [Capsulimonas sp.]|uniref:precorrin-2 dehydrogenase/sirohydrochlorin ferrochelatase family protein n=1 Tax=Capsulimonas sp. TaxID=2494211 RepID=UPI003267BB86